MTAGRGFDFTLSDEQVLIRDMAARFAAEHGAQGGADPCALRHALAEQGLLGLGLPESFGGVGGPIEISLVCQEFGRVALRDHFVATAIFPAQLVLAAASDAQKNRLLPRMASGETVAAVAYRESDRAHGAPPLAEARREGAGYRLNGSKALVLGAPSADLLFVDARLPGDSGEGGGPTWFVVDGQGEGVTIESVPLVDGVTGGTVELRDAAIDGDAILGDPGAALETLERASIYAILGQSSETAGLMRGALSISAEYLRTRHQFGAPLSSFQALRHRFADCEIALEMAESAILRLLACLESGESDELSRVASMTKYLVDDYAQRVCAEAIQFHGGIGLTEEHGIGQFYRRATLNKMIFGGPSDHLGAYSAHLAADRGEGTA